MLTAPSFRALCTGELGGELTYKGTTLHRIVKTFAVQGGDTSKTGSGGMNIYNNARDAFAGEDLYWRDIDEPWLLCAADEVPKSQFFITLRSSPHLNGKYCCIGRVVKGQQILEQISEVEVDDEDAPLEPVTIQRAGELAYKGPAAHVQLITALSSQGDTGVLKAPERGRSTTRSPSRARARSRSRRRNLSSSSAESIEEEQTTVEHSRPVSRDRRHHDAHSRDRRHHHRRRHHGHHSHHRRHSPGTHHKSRSGSRSRSRSHEHRHERNHRHPSPGNTKKRRSRDHSKDGCDKRKHSRRGSRDFAPERPRHEYGHGSRHSSGRYEANREEHHRPRSPGPPRDAGEPAIVYKGRGQMRYDARDGPRHGRL